MGEGGDSGYGSIGGEGEEGTYGKDETEGGREKRRKHPAEGGGEGMGGRKGGEGDRYTPARPLALDPLHIDCIFIASTPFPPPPFSSTHTM